MAQATTKRSSPTRRSNGAAAKPTKAATRAAKAKPPTKAKAPSKARATSSGKASGNGKAPSRAKAPSKAKAPLKGKTESKAGGTVRRMAEAIKPGRPRPVSRLARMAALKGLKLLGRKALDATAAATRSAVGRTAVAGRGAFELALESGLSRRLPIQVAVDVAVPIAVAWEEWMTFRAMTEGVHRIEDVERDGDHLTGRTAGPGSADWEAEIVDEREEEAFAWRSVEGSDCAGLATFHQLSERLTRIELDLDVLPTGPVETLAFSLHVAHRRAEAELRRFKASVEFISPDAYDVETTHNGSGPESENDSP